MFFEKDPANFQRPIKQDGKDGKDQEEVIYEGVTLLDISVYTFFRKDF